MLGKQRAVVSRAGWAAPQSVKHTAAHARFRDIVGIPTLDEELLARLKELRRDLAADQHVPAFRIMSNETLMLLALHKPTTREAALELNLKGIGPFTAKRYLSRFTALIKDYLGQ